MTETTDTFRPPGLRPEAELLLWSARISPEEERVAAIRALVAGGIDWDALLRLAMHNRIPTLLYQHLAAARVDGVPPEIMERLGGFFHQVTVRNMYLARELVALVDLFRTKGIEALPYKGPILAQSLYGNLGLRQFWDLDIVVHKEDVLRVKDLLVERGYKPERELSRAEETALLESDCEYNFDSDDGRVHLEIHWRILPQPFVSRFDTRFVWDRAVTVDLVNTKTLTLPPEELFLILCMHGGDKHQWARLKWICDIARFIDTNRTIDWDQVLKDAAILGKTKTVFFALHLAASLLGAECKGAVKTDGAKVSEMKARAGLVRARLFREDFGLPGFSEWLAYMYAGEERKGGGVSDLLRYLRVVMQPEFRDRYTLSLPPWLSFLSYPYRMWRLAREHKGDLISRLR